MTTNVFFNNFESYAEQTLIEDLIIESIRIYGHDLYYCPRTVIAKDDLYNEDAVSEYKDAYLVEMYIKNVEGFEGEGDFLSKFNIQIRDEMTLTVANRTFQNEVGAEEVLTRPREGDLIYMPLTGKVYVVKYAEHEAPVFYQMGALQCYDLRIEQFEYSNEKLNTGVPEIDVLETNYSINAGIQTGVNAYANGDLIIDANTGRPTYAGANTYSMDNDPYAENNKYDTLDSFVDWSEVDPFSEGNV